MYWGSLLRDVAFTDHASNEIAAQAADELSGMPTYAGPEITRAASRLIFFLFRGPYPGRCRRALHPQFQSSSTFLGAQAISQQTVTYAAGVWR